MIVALARFELRIPVRSLKEKRRVVRSLVDRVKARFDVRVSEVEGQDTWQRAVLGFAVVGSDRGVLEALVAKVLDFVLESDSGQLVADARETLAFGDLTEYGDLE